MITVDSQIWIYYLDPNAVENQDVSQFLEGLNNDGPLFTGHIHLNGVVPVEVAHNLFGNKDLDPESIYGLLTAVFGALNIEVVDITPSTMVHALKILLNYRSKGIGGRDALILATMGEYNVNTIITHDTNILSLVELRRVDPVLRPALILEVGEVFDRKDFKRRIKSQNQPQ